MDSGESLYAGLLTAEKVRTATREKVNKSKIITGFLSDHIERKIQE